MGAKIDIGVCTSPVSQEFSRHRDVPLRVREVECRLDIQNDRPDLDRKPSRRNDSAERFIHENEFVTGRVNIVKRADLHEIGEPRLQKVDEVRIFTF